MAAATGDYISKAIKVCYIDENRGHGYRATKDIPKNHVILIENARIFSEIDRPAEIKDMLCIIYKILMSSSKIINQFLAMVPKSLSDASNIIDYTVLSNALNCSREYIRSYLGSIDPELLCLYCAKFMQNAFNCNNPMILFKGALFNHSCQPNVTFIYDKQSAYFITLRQIKKGEEICDHYTDLRRSITDSHYFLKHQYGFVCKCNGTKNAESIYKLRNSCPQDYPLF